MTILVTGAGGMIGSALVKKLTAEGYRVIGVGRSGEETAREHYRFIRADLADRARLFEIVESERVDRIVHLAALAHRDGLDHLTWERYKRDNVDCANNVFACAGDRPVLFISTIDVYGFYRGGRPVNALTPAAPVSDYGKSKALAERGCQLLHHYDIFRFCPVYTPENKRDIQKRYYLKYPVLAYRVGKGTAFEVLSVEHAVKAMTDWCASEPANSIRIIKDPELLWTPDMIKTEKKAGRAKFVLHVPAWCVDLGSRALETVLGENEKTYLINKLAHPLRTE